MNVSLQAFPSAPWVLHENHVETSQSNAVKGSPRVIGKQEVQMHRHKTLMNEPELQARAVPSSDRANHEFNISPGAPSHVAPRSSQVQIQNDWKSASKGSEKGEKKNNPRGKTVKDDNGFADESKISQLLDTSRRSYCEDWLNGHAWQLVVSGMRSACRTASSSVPQGQYWPQPYSASFEMAWILYCQQVWRC